jgi:hypothetical protein
MSGHIRYELNKSRFGIVRLLSPDTRAKDAATKVASALGHCLNTKITYRRKGWFGPKIAQLDFGGQVVELQEIDGAFTLDLLGVDDETRETITELLRHSPLFDRR